MKQYIQHKPTGEIIAVAITDNPDKFGLVPPVLVWRMDERIDPTSYYIKQGQPTLKGPKPTERSVFDYETGSWVEPEFTADEELSLTEQARFKRGELLAASDWTQVADAPVDKAAWATYRQALRGITSQEGFPYSVVWPDKP